MNIRLLAACFFLFLASITSAFAAEDRRVALVIGNSAYENVPRLPNPVNDATAIGAALSRLGFDVTLLTDVGKVALDQGLADFSEKSSGADLALVFYAGHGIEMGGVNYLIPVDARLKTDLRVPFETVSLNSVLDAVSAARKLRVVLLDACRNNPFAEKMTRSIGAKRKIGRGLTDVAAGPNELISYAAFAGKEASDGDGIHSPYTEALLANIERPGIEIGKLFRIVADEVQAKTNGEQVPYESARLPGTDIYLKEPVEKAPVESEPVAKEPAEAVAVEGIEEDWLQAKKSGDADMLKAFIEVHGANKMYRLLAEQQLALLPKPDKTPSSDMNDEDAERQAVVAALPDLPEQLPAFSQTLSTEDQKLPVADQKSTTVDQKLPATSQKLQSSGQNLSARKSLATNQKLPVVDQKLAAIDQKQPVVGAFGKILPALTQDQANRPETECDRLAADPLDRQKLKTVKGVDTHAINVALAKPACQAAMRDHPDEPTLMFQLGRVYYADKQFADAMRWFKSAVDRGYAAAANSLSVMYLNGDGVKADEAEAAKWLKRAADLGGIDAISNLSAAVAKAEPRTSQEELHRTANQENPESMFAKGVSYRDGRGVPADLQEAVVWFRRAHAAGSPDAGFEIAKLLAKTNLNVAQFREIADMMIISLRRGSKPAYKNVMSGMRDWPVDFRFAFQRRLADQGIYSGKLDGIFGQDTKKAINTIFAKN